MSKYITRAAVREIANDLSSRLDRCEGPALSSVDHVRRAAFRMLADEVRAAVERLDALAREVRVSPQPAADLATARAMNKLMMELADALPAVCGGSPDADDDYEETDPEFLTDPAWPAYPDPAVDGDAWELGPDDATPLSVLAADAPTWEPSPQDWADMMGAVGSPLSEADHAVLHGCC